MLAVAREDALLAASAAQVLPWAHPLALHFESLPRPGWVGSEPGSMAAEERPVMLFDGTCGFCNLWAQLAVRFERDSGPSTLLFASLCVPSPASPANPNPLAQTIRRWQANERAAQTVH